MSRRDAIVVGSGPNGLVAAVTLARAGLSVDVYEAASDPGGGCRTAELTLPGFHHDVCSAVHPLLLASPAFQDLDLASRGVRLRTPSLAFAHPLDGGRAAGVGGTVADVGGVARRRPGRLRPRLRPARARRGQDPPRLPRDDAHGPPPPRRGRGLRAPRARLGPGDGAAAFATDEARGLIAGAAAHSMLPLTAPLSGAFPRLFGLLAHRYGWPVVEGGSAAVVDALVGELTSLGGRVETGCLVKSLADLPPAATVVLDVTPRQLLELAGDRLPPRYARALARYRYGPGVCKVDWALSGPVPWAAPACRETVTVHVGGTFEEIARGEADVNAGRHPERPFVPGGAAVRRRPRTRPRRPADVVGLLPRPQRLRRGHDRSHRGADRTLRSRVPRPDPGPHDLHRGGRGGAQPELRRR